MMQQQQQQQQEHQQDFNPLEATLDQLAAWKTAGVLYGLSHISSFIICYCFNDNVLFI